ncbi:HNH endonuclease [uncultured Martelella sp.]|uniref:HNH endonuclease n=1 Tax=uncultured Martelella sp. TaxID=392331 RepID=UPI0029C773BC|nr:HNH endonuclease [uncultured Martelella sp.]
MTYGVFIHRSDSIYDDSPAERYQFPAQYRRRVEACVGDWIVYYEPSKVRETRGYFAVAKVQAVIQDPSAANMFIALIEPGTYLDFVNPVPFNHDGTLIERGLLNEAGRISGRAQSAVRPLSAQDFNRILSLGLDETVQELPRIDTEFEAPVHDGFHEQGQQPFVFEEQRIRIPQLNSRVVRDRLFRRLVITAYDKRCAITGLKLINGGGRAEVDAAHIRPVEHSGPDILTNGIALSGTAHWMFDRGLIALSDDLDILVSRQANDPDSIHSLINSTGKAIAPTRATQRPHPRFLQWHRENCFKH